MPDSACRCRCLRVLASLWFALLPTIALADDGMESVQRAADSWPQLRGPERAGTVAVTGLAEAWPESGPVELWRRPVGSGFSAVVVVAGLAYTMEAVGEEEAVLALDAATGETKWRSVVGVPIESEFGRGPRATPTIANGRLFTVSSQSQLVALDARTGETLWHHDLTRFEPTPRFGYAVSPLVIGDAVVVAIGTQDLIDAARAKLEAAAHADAGDANDGEAPTVATSDASDGESPPAAPPIEVPPQVGALAALHAVTGELLWRGGFPGSSGYSSPVLLSLAGVPQIVTVRRDSTVGTTLDGRELWTYPTAPTAAIAMPVQVSDDTVFISSSDDHFGGKALTLSRADDGSWRVQEAWAERLMRNHFNTSVAVDGVLYGFDNTTFKALDAATGERRWVRRGFGKGSLLAAGDLLYVLGDTGQLALVRATPEEYLEMGRVQAMTGKAWTSPSLADGRLFLRDHDELVVYDVRAVALAATDPDPSVAPATPTPPGDLSEPDAAALRRAAEAAEALSAARIVARHVEARGGAESWQRVRALTMTGTYQAFSETSDFVLRRARGPQDAADSFYLRYTVFGSPAVRAVDADGPWLQHKFLSPEPVRVSAEPQIAAYLPQMLREAHFGPLLLDVESLGLSVDKAGIGEINGRPTVALTVTFPAGDSEPAAEPVTETWHLDPQSFLEVAVDSHVLDYTQGGAPYLQRRFTSDFRDVHGVMIPFRVDLEFNARFEGMSVEAIEVNPQLDAADFAPPAAPAPEASSR